MKNLTDFIQKPDDKPKIVTCKCGSRFSSKLLRCPHCHLVYESPEEEKTWRNI